MAKQGRYIVMVNRVMAGRASQVPDERWEYEVYALTLAGAILKAVKAKPEWFDCSLGQLDVTAFCMEER
jgi:hypothetical protein